MILKLLNMIITALTLIIIAVASFNFFSSSQPPEYETHHISVKKILDIGQLCIARFTTSSYYEYAGKKDVILMVEGDIYYFINFKTITIEQIDPGRINLTIDPPTFEIELDEEKIGIFAREKNFGISDHDIFNYSEVVEELIIDVAQKKKLKLAKEEAGQYLRNYLKQIDITVHQIRWRVSSKK